MIAVLASSALLTGCVGTMNQVVRQVVPAAPAGQQQGGIMDALAQFRVPNVFSASEPVVLEMTSGAQSFATEKGHFAEAFIVLPPAARGSNDHKQAVAAMTRLGGAMKGKLLEAYIYTSPAQFRDPSVRDLFDAANRSAGPNRVMVKADPRMTGNTVLVWVRDPMLASASDALISAEKRGLTSKSQ